MTPTVYATAPFNDFFIGLDLGKVNDYTALVVLARTGKPGSYRYRIAHLERARGKPYPEIVTAVQLLTSHPALHPRRQVAADRDGPARIEASPKPHLIIDSTGVGSPVTDMVLAAHLDATPVPMTITGGMSHRKDRWPGSGHRQAYWVAKSLLVSTVQAILSSGRLTIAQSLPYAGDLKDELMAFNVRVSDAGNESYGAWRTGTHDDLVLALALAAWFAEHKPETERMVIGAHPFAGYRGG